MGRCSKKQKVAHAWSGPRNWEKSRMSGAPLERLDMVRPGRGRSGKPSKARYRLGFALRELGNHCSVLNRATLSNLLFVLPICFYSVFFFKALL